MTGLMEKNCDKLKWSKYGRSPQLRYNKRKKEQKRKIHNPINTHSFQKKTALPLNNNIKMSPAVP